ncbi:MAG: hypothetical protein HOF01_04130 [Chloroflexi bacterium]|nr:hypothetical protein [Chloroflexota bacterium]
MTTPPRRPPDPSSRRTSRSDKVRNAKSDQYGGVGRGMGDAPNSRMKMIGMWVGIGLLVLFMIFGITD